MTGASRILATAIVALCAAAPARAEEDAFSIGKAVYKETNSIESDSDDPIAASLAKCLQRGDTYGMSLCFNDAVDRYDKVLNSIYQDALKNNDEKTDGLLRQAQRRWLVFHAADRKAQQAYAPGRGTVMASVLGHSQVSAMRQRIAELMVFMGFGQD